MEITHDEKSIRKRESYKRFEKLMNTLSDVKNKGAVIVEVFNMLEQYSAFRSQTASDYARESILLLFKDYNIPSSECVKMWK